MPTGQVLFMRGPTAVSHDALAEDNDAWDDTDLVKAYDEALKEAKAEVAQRIGIVATEIPSATESCSSQKGNNGTKSKNKKKKRKQRREWAIGDHCRARYAADGLYYEGTITSFNRVKGTCMIQFTGYGDEQEESVSLLLPSLGSAVRRKQENEAIQLLGSPESAVRGEQENQTTEREIITDMEASEVDASDHPSTSSSRMNTHSYGAHGHSSKMFAPRPPTGSPGLFQDMVPPPPPLHVTNSLPKEESEALSAMLMSWYMSGFHTGYFQGLKRAQRKDPRM